MKMNSNSSNLMALQNIINKMENSSNSSGLNTSSSGSAFLRNMLGGDTESEAFIQKPPQPIGEEPAGEPLIHTDMSVPVPIPDGLSATSSGGINKNVPDESTSEEGVMQQNDGVIGTLEKGVKQVGKAFVDGVTAFGSVFSSQPENKIETATLAPAPQTGGNIARLANFL